MNVAVYYRVSTKAQGDGDRLGLPVQRKTVQAYCRERGYVIVTEFEDRSSGADANRAALADLLSRKGEFEAVVVYKWDRLARDTMLDGFLRYTLRQNGVACISATEQNGLDPIAKLTQEILTAVAAYERVLITQRMVAARRLKASRGGYAAGQPPYGYRAVGGALEPRSDEHEGLAEMRRLREQGETLRAIAKRMNEAGFKPRMAGAWGPSSVLSALKAAPTQETD